MMPTVDVMICDIYDMCDTDVKRFLSFIVQIATIRNYTWRVEFPENNNEVIVVYLNIDMTCS